MYVWFLNDRQQRAFCILWTCSSWVLKTSKDRVYGSCSFYCLTLMRKKFFLIYSFSCESIFLLDPLFNMLNVCHLSGAGCKSLQSHFNSFCNFINKFLACMSLRCHVSSTLAAYGLQGEVTSLANNSFSPTVQWEWSSHCCVGKVGVLTSMFSRGLH